MFSSISFVTRVHLFHDWHLRADNCFLYLSVGLYARRQTHIKCTLLMDLCCIGVVQPHTACFPQSPHCQNTHTILLIFKELTLHCTKVSTLKIMVEWHLAPSYWKQHPPLSSSKASSLLQRKPFTPSCVSLTCDKLCFPSFVCGFTHMIRWNCAASGFLCPRSVCVCASMYLHTQDWMLRVHRLKVGWLSPFFWDRLFPWAWRSLLLIGCLTTNHMVSTC